MSSRLFFRYSHNSSIFLDARRAFEGLDIHTRERPLRRELADILPQGLECLRALSLIIVGDTEEVLDEFRARLLLDLGGDFDDAVKEGSDNFDIFLTHITRGNGSCAKADATRHLSRLCKSNSASLLSQTQIRTYCHQKRHSLRSIVRKRNALESTRHTVDRDANQVADLFNFAASKTIGPEIPKDKMVI